MFHNVCVLEMVGFSSGGPCQLMALELVVGD